MITGIAGSGRLAQALGRCLVEAGSPIDAIASRSFPHAQAAASFIGGNCRPVELRELDCDRVLIAVSDRAIVEVAGDLSGCSTLLHTCGAHGAELLNEQRAKGISCGSLHPFQTIASAESGYRVLPGSAFAIDGDPSAVEWAEEIVQSLNGSILRIPPASRAIYHAAAAMASNHLIAILGASEQLLELAGVPARESLHAVGSISGASLANALQIGPPAALTGPVQRGDASTVSRHLEALGAAQVSVRNLYRAASVQALAMAERRGLDRASSASLHALLDSK